MKTILNILSVVFFVCLTFTSCTETDISDLEPSNKNVENLVGEDGNVIEEPDAG